MTGLLEISSQTNVNATYKSQSLNHHSSRNITDIKKDDNVSFIVQSIFNTIKKPLVWAPPLALAIYLMGLEFQK